MGRAAVYEDERDRAWALRPGSVDNSQDHAQCGRATRYRQRLRARQTQSRWTVPGVDITLNARFSNDRLLQGGVSFGRSVIDNCFVVESSEQARPGFCRAAAPWSSTVQFKLAGAYPLPGRIQVSGTLQNINTFAYQAMLRGQS